MGVHQGQKVRAHFFVCPDCRKKHPFLWENDDIRKLRQKNKQHQDKMGEYIRAKQIGKAEHEKWQFEQGMTKARGIKGELKERFPFP